MAISRARHRASVAPFAWASRALLSAATVPVGALAGCVVAVVSSSAQRPEVGVASLAVAGIPLGLHGWRTRRAGRHLPRGRHVAGIEQIWPDAEVVAAPVVERTAARQPEVRQPLRASLVLALADAAPAAGALALPAPRSGRAAEVLLSPQGEQATPRVFTVSAAREVVEVVEVVRGEQRDAEIAQLQEIWDAGTGPDTGAVTAVVTAVAGHRVHAA